MPLYSLYNVSGTVQAGVDSDNYTLQFIYGPGMTSCTSCQWISLFLKAYINLPYIWDYYDRNTGYWVF